MSTKIQTHPCIDNKPSAERSWWERDAKGIPLCRVCARCKAKKLARYRPAILSGYHQSDVDEPIESEHAGLGNDNDYGCP